MTKLIGQNAGTYCKDPAAGHQGSDGHSPTAGHARGTNAVKHSAKLFTALAALALFAVVMVGIQDRSADAQSGGTTGQVYLTNMNSCLTTQASPPSSLTCGGAGREFVGSGETLYSTVIERDSEAPHAAMNNIAADADTLIVTVIDSDADVAQDGMDTADINTAAGQFTVVEVPDNQTPITSSASEIGLMDTASGATFSGAVVTLVGDDFIGFAGTIPGGGLTNVTISWEYSDVDSLDVVAYSLTDAPRDHVTVSLQETGDSTGVFEGYVKLIANVVINNDQGPGTDSGSPGATAELKVNSSAKAFIKYSDELDSGGDDDTVVRASTQVETTPPQAIISEPANGLNTQTRQLAFRGTVTDDRSGIDVSSIMLFVDQGDDPDNNHQVITAGGGDSGYSMTGANTEAFDTAEADDPDDGDKSIAWSVAEPGNLPTDVIAVQPDHQVDFILVAVDLAGNIGYSDSDTTTSGVGVILDDPATDDNEATSEPHVITIDQVRPRLVSAQTGLAPDGDDEGDEPDTNNRRSIGVTFDDAVEGVDPEDFQVTLDDDTNLVPTGAVADGMMVFLELETDLPTNDTPVVRLQGAVSDPAGNTTSSGSDEAEDGLSPVLTVELSGGSGSGEGAMGPTALTKNEITVTISSDEPLSGLPSVEVFTKDGDDADEDPDSVTSLSVVSQGGEMWIARATRSRLAMDGVMSLVVSGTDVSAASNPSTVGNADPSNDNAIKFTVDSTAPSLVTEDSSTSQGRPSIRIAFDEAVMVTAATIGDTVLVDDEMNLLATSDNKLFFYVPSEDLELGKLTVKATASDYAGNTAKDVSYELTVEERKAFNLDLFFGWNAVSVPSNPVDPDINAVFTNESLAQVVAYDATDAESPWRIASRDPVSGAWTSTTDTPLATILAGPGYWVHSTSFDDQSISLAGPIEPGSGQAPRVESISTGAGWNFVGVIDTTRGNTQGDSGVSLARADGTFVTADRYFASVDARRAFRYEATLQSFVEIALNGRDTVKIGDGIWVFVVPEADGSTPAIAP